ncbi:MAG: DUF3037 domain-containing protein [Clostridium sp.]|nr:DUF3037 domain-containing protein [Clostridium sp.]
MNQNKKKILYSIVRFSPDELKGEIINTGVVFHNIEEKRVKYYLIDDKSPKLKAVVENDVEINLYKTYKEMLEYYIDNSKDDISGVVGELCIASFYDDEYMNKLYKYYEDKKMSLSEPNIAYTKNESKLFETILNRYVGKSNVEIEKVNTMTAKRYIRKIFSSNENLKKRIENDKIIKPIKELTDLEVKIDFSFKNIKWNYMQAIPKINKNNKNEDWFSKVQLLLDSNTEESKIHLLYKMSDIVNDEGTLNLLNYLKNRYSSIEIHDLDKDIEVKNLCDRIELEGRILEFEEAV